MYDLNKTQKWLAAKSHVGIFLLRLFIGLRLIYGVIDNIISWEKMIEFSKFLENLNFPFPLANAVLSVYAQFVCGILILIGFNIRVASFIMIINFLIALVFVHFKVSDSIEGMTPALAMLFGCATFLFTGAEKFAIQNIGHLKTLLRL